jgi:hypothetical protein
MARKAIGGVAPGWLIGFLVRGDTVFLLVMLLMRAILNGVIFLPLTNRVGYMNLIFGKIFAGKSKDFQHGLLARNGKDWSDKTWKLGLKKIVIKCG